MAGGGLFNTGDPWARGGRALEGDLDITPMIDVTFLLLVFFMVSSTMQARPSIDLPPADHSLGVDARGASVITLYAATESSAARIVLGDGRGEEGDLDDVRAYVADAVFAGQPRMVIKAEGDVPHALVNEVSLAIVSVEGAELYLGVGDRPVE